MMEFDMVLIFVRDMARALEFYVNLLGFRLTSHKTIFEASKDMFAVVEGYGVRLGLHLDEEATASRDKIVFRVESIDDAVQFLEDRGIGYTGPTEVAEGIYEVVIKDPDGREISIVSYG